MNVATAPSVDRTRYPYRMKDLCELTGLERQVIHFYIQQGLLPEGKKTGRNMAYYGPEHVERIKLVKKLQTERFLPLKAIRAILEGRDEQFSSDQRALLVEVKQRIAETLSGGSGKTVDAAPHLSTHGISSQELSRMAELGVLTTIESGGRTLVPEDDLWIVELWGELRRAGFSEDLGYTVEDMALYEESVSKLFEREVALFRDRLTHLPPDEVAARVERGLALVNVFLARYHMTKARRLFASLL